MVCNYCAPGLIWRAENPTGICPLIPAVWPEFCCVTSFTRQSSPQQTGKHRPLIIYLSLVLILCLDVLISWKKDCEGQCFVLKGKGECRKMRNKRTKIQINFSTDESALRPLHRKEAVLSNHSPWKLYKLLTFCASERVSEKNLFCIYSSEKKSV